ncbi:hypothetical protein [Clostridium butyricum]|uniref:hypothetical protein n=1 Tax=Clostridium butyricum TaxID=1492 RepID=UPI00374E8FF4
MSKKINECYWCGNIATSKEHVPPKCLFPEKKDMQNISEANFRKDLITVPSCDEHNLEKSNDDEYLMECIASIVGNNGIAYIHSRTKVARSLARNSKALDIVSNGTLKINNTKFPVSIINVDTKRLSYSFEAIARALYYYECGKQFNGECRVFSPIFRNALNEEGCKWLDYIKSEIENEKDKWEEKGSNPEIFKYRLGLEDSLGSRLLLLTFYNNVEIYITLTSIRACEYFRNNGLRYRKVGK